MLGVLAIIGVLSIGAIAGYSKAMFKYKMNKTLDVLSHAIARMVELDSMKWGEDDTIEAPQDMIKYGIPCEETTFEETPVCKLPNGDMWIMPVMSSTYMMTLLFQNNPFDSCVAFLNSGKYGFMPGVRRMISAFNCDKYCSPNCKTAPFFSNSMAVSPNSSRVRLSQAMTLAPCLSN